MISKEPFDWGMFVLTPRCDDEWPQHPPPFVLNTLCRGLKERAYGMETLLPMMAGFQGISVLASAPQWQDHQIHLLILFFQTPGLSSPFPVVWITVQPVLRELAFQKPSPWSCPRDLLVIILYHVLSPWSTLQGWITADICLLCTRELGFPRYLDFFSLLKLWIYFYFQEGPPAPPRSLGCHQ